MKILMLTPYLPYPIWSGGQIRTYNLLKNLSKKHEITLYSFIRDEQEKEYIPRLKKYCIDVKVFKKRPPWAPKSLFLSAVTYYPLVVCMYYIQEVKKAIAKELERQRFDIIHAETFYVMPNIPPNTIPTILAEQTIEYLVYKHYTKSIQFLLLKLLMEWDVVKIKFWEKRFWQKATRVVTMSLPDKKIMQSLIPNLPVDLVPNGVDVSFFEKRKDKIDSTRPTILFVGNFKWLQNREAVSILMKDIWPQIVSRIPKATLWIIGRHPPKSIRSYQSSSVRITEDMEDIRKAYIKSDVLLAPIYGPGGTRYKILEAMATGLPVVTTTTGIEGLGAVHNKHAIISDNVKVLASETVTVLTNPSLYRKLAKNGRELVERQFNWEMIANKLDRIYKEAAHHM
ncbi:glycosyltransferase [Candidatus Gottesmanbacteria bacterium]|nr:glycosyltransferase [Candidatus Gottesmanbacteria bacterium]